MERCVLTTPPPPSKRRLVVVAALVVKPSSGNAEMEGLSTPFRRVVVEDSSMYILWFALFMCGGATREGVHRPRVESI